MKIRITKTPPVSSWHGVKQGQVHEVVGDPKRGRVRWWIIGDLGEKVGILASEAEVVEE